MSEYESHAVASGTLALHDLFTAAETNFKLGKKRTELGKDRPLRLQMRAATSEPMPPDAMDADKTIMLLSLELRAPDGSGEVFVQGPVECGMATPKLNEHGHSHEPFERAPCGAAISRC